MCMAMHSFSLHPCSMRSPILGRWVQFWWVAWLYCTNSSILLKTIRQNQYVQNALASMSIQSLTFFNTFFVGVPFQGERLPRAHCGSWCVWFDRECNSIVGHSLSITTTHYTCRFLWSKLRIQSNQPYVFLQCKHICYLLLAHFQGESPLTMMLVPFLSPLVLSQLLNC